MATQEYDYCCPPRAYTLLKMPSCPPNYSFRTIESCPPPAPQERQRTRQQWLREHRCIGKGKHPDDPSVTPIGSCHRQLWCCPVETPATPSLLTIVPGVTPTTPPVSPQVQQQPVLHPARARQLKLWHLAVAAGLGAGIVWLMKR
jgi:hypothetical protein